MVDQHAIRTAIERVHALYTFLVDDQRLDEWGELFCREGVWALGSHEHVGRKNIVTAITSVQPPKPGMARHITYAPVLDFEGDQVFGWSDGLAMVVSGSPDEFMRAEPSQIVAVIRYYDVMRFEEGRWRFWRRTVVASGMPLPPGVRPCPGY